MLLPSLHPPGKIGECAVSECNHRRDGSGAVQCPQIIIRGLIGLRRRHSSLDSRPRAQCHAAHRQTLPVLQFIVRQPPRFLVEHHGHLHCGICPSCPDGIEELSFLVIGVVLQCILLPLQRIPSLSHLLCLVPESALIIRGQNFLILRPLSGQIEINQLHHREKSRKGENRNLLLHTALHPIIKIIAVQRHHIERTGHGRTQQIASPICLYSGKKHAMLILPEVWQLLSSCSVKKRLEQRRMTLHRIKLIRPALQSVFLRPAVTYQTDCSIKPDKVINFLLRVVSSLCHLYTPCRVFCGIRGRNARMGFLPYRDIGANGTLSILCFVSASILAEYQLHSI